MWLGTGLKLEQFLKLPRDQRRGRFYELEDTNQIMFVERCLNSLEAMLGGWPPEPMLPEMSPYGRDPNELVEAPVISIEFSQAELNKQEFRDLVRMLAPTGDAEAGPPRASAEILNLHGAPDDCE